MSEPHDVRLTCAQTMRSSPYVLGALTLTLLVPHTALAECHASEALALVAAADAIIEVNPDEAISKYDQATRLDEKNHTILWKLALAYKRKENWDKVSFTLAKASELAPSFASYLWLRGHAMVEQARKLDALKDVPEARALFEKAVAMDPNHADAHFDLADVLARAGYDQNALVHYTKAIELAPNRASYYPPLGDLYWRLGYADQAVAVAREAERQGASSFPLLMLWGHILEEKKAMPEALAKYSEAKAACGPCNGAGQPMVFFALGNAYASVKPPRKAEAAQNLVSFQKVICKGGAAARYADQCAQAQDILRSLQTP